MATPTGAQKAALEKKALAADSKSAGMRMLFDRGYAVATVAALFGVRYSFAYGVYNRHGATGGTTPRAARPKSSAKAPARKSTAKASAKAPARSSAKASASKSKAKAKA